MPEELTEEAPAAEEGAGGLSRSLTAPAAPQVEGQSWVGIWVNLGEGDGAVRGTNVFSIMANLDCVICSIVPPTPHDSHRRRAPT